VAYGRPRKATRGGLRSGGLHLCIGHCLPAPRNAACHLGCMRLAHTAAQGSCRSSLAGLGISRCACWAPRAVALPMHSDTRLTPSPVAPRQRQGAPGGNNRRGSHLLGENGFVPHFLAHTARNNTGNRPVDRKLWQLRLERSCFFAHIWPRHSKTGQNQAKSFHTRLNSSFLWCIFAALSAQGPKRQGMRLRRPCHSQLHHPRGPSPSICAHEP
jgi:hypothetical protein